MYGIAHLSIIPVRAEAKHASEMVTQLLFGEYYQVIDKKKDWKKIKLSYDAYEGWISDNQFCELSFDHYREFEQQSLPILGDMMQLLINTDAHHLLPIVLGSNLPFMQQNSLLLGEKKYQINGNIIHYDNDKPNVVNKQQVVQFAHHYLSAPYFWGGRSPLGIDCSGLTQMVFKLAGIKLQRDAYQQATQGETIGMLGEAQPADLAYFANDDGKITHVGILLNSSQIIHASGLVRIDPIDQYGIFNPQTKKYTHKLRIIKRVV